MSGGRARSPRERGPARRTAAHAGPWPAALLLAWALAWAAPAQAQDAHYWSYGYGPVGQLTEGTLVGGVSDLSAVYYNPGALALLDEPRFVFGLRSIELATIRAPGAAGPGLDLDSTVFDVVPSLVAGRIGAGDGRAGRFAYALLSRHDTDWDLAYNDAALTPAGGSAGFGRLRERVVEYWAGGSWSRRLRPGLALGVSPFLAWRAQRSRRSLALEDVAAAGSQAAFVARESEYNHARVVLKAGVAWRRRQLELGLTATTPGLPLYSRGKVAFNASASSDSEPALASASLQKGLDATYRSPWSIAGGASWRGRRRAVHATAEWFSSVAPYEILSPEPAPVTGSDAAVPLTFVGAARGVVNFGAGLEQPLGTRLTLYAGAARNASPWRPESETLASWDLAELTTGVTFRTGRGRVGIGVGYAWGEGDLPRTIDPPFQPRSNDPTRASFARWTFSVAASRSGSGR